MKILESENFKKRLRNIALYIKQDNLSASVMFVKNLKKSINKIADMPKLYRKSYYFDDENMRDMTYEGYTIIYEIRDEVIEIQDIFNKNLPL